MCGFVGGNILELDYVEAAARIRHRGPDDHRVWTDERMTLAFRRLSVIDLDARAAQPMWHREADVGVVFNGEIYGFDRLRGTLQSLGHVFHSRSDTEVLLNAYVEWGEQFVERIDGMFAIAIYDRRTSRVQLWRDRVGIKPLYYFWDGKRFAFASEIKAFTVLFPGELRPRLDAYYDFLTYQCVPAPKTSWKNVEQLRPAHTMTYDVRAMTLSSPRPYWKLEVEPLPSDEDTWRIAERLRDAISTSVRQQLVADVPVGCFLSGGIDSSVVTLEASHQTSELNTFSVGFESDRDERPFARLVAGHAGTQHQEQVFARDEMDLSLLREWFDDPFADTSAFPTHAVAKAASAKVTVALSGDGGDELFGGYARYERYRDRTSRIERLFDACERVKQLAPHGSWARRAMNGLALAMAPSLPSYAKLLSGLSRGEKWELAREWGIPLDYDDYWAWREYWRPDLPPRTRLQYVDFHRYLPDDLLTKVDRTSMAESLEVRVPLLSREIVELAFQIPESTRYRGGPKGILRQAYRDLLPAEVLERPKQGFGVPRSFQHLPAFYRPALLLQRLFAIDLPQGFLPPPREGGPRG